MNKNKIAVIMVILLGVMAIFLIFKDRKGTIDRKSGEFAINDTSTVTKIFLADKQDNKVLLVKEKPGSWKLNDKYLARNSGVELLLKTMSTITVKAPVSKSGYNSVIRQLAANSVKVEVYQMKFRVNILDKIKLMPREKLTKVYYVGAPTPDNMGTFMMLEGSEIPFVVYQPGFRGFVSARFSANLNDWRDHTIFAKNQKTIRSIRVEFPQEPDESYLIEKSAENTVDIVQLSTNKKIERVDASRVVDLISAYKRINFESLLESFDQTTVDSIISRVPLNVITLTDTAGNVDRVKTFRLRKTAGDFDLDGNLVPYDLDRLFAFIENQNELVLIQYFVFDPITRPLSFLINAPQTSK